ncbi:MAG: diacylglycerol kinase family lipid kinase [Chloroflexi bacterium]|nr:diacylglycerol kinase family lipid kinase [Chloroflexota bacterium]
MAEVRVALSLWYADPSTWNSRAPDGSFDEDAAAPRAGRMKSAVLIGNPAAGRKVGLATNPATVEDAAEALRRHGITPEVWLTSGPDEAELLARRALNEGRELIIAAGGDGTVQEVAQPLVGSEAALGIMPLGSVMNLARTLGIERDLDAAAEVIATGRLLKMDVGEVNGRHFLEYAGVGIDAALTPLTERLDHGDWSAIVPLLRMLLRFRPPRMNLSVDGRPELVRAMMVIIANTPYFLWALELSPEARVNDRLFDIKIFSRFTLVEMALFGLRIARGQRPAHPKLLLRRGKTVAVSAARRLAVHADTHVVGNTPIAIRLIPHALRVMAHPSLWTHANAASPIHRVAPAEQRTAP